MHGVGGAVFLRVLEQAGFPEPVVVAEQFEPDADFPTVAFPNPEEPGAMDLALAAAMDNQVAVIVNRPFEEGDLFRAVKGKALPDFAAEIGCTSWAQFFLKWIISNPAVTCAIPGTGRVAHIEDNMAACTGRARRISVMPSSSRACGTGRGSRRIVSNRQSLRTRR